jgi:hypothetical protein
MILRILLFSAALFFFCSPAYNQEYTYDGTLTQDDIDQSTLYGSPDDINQMDEGKAYMDQIIVPNDYEATTGCLLVQQRTWNGTEGGQCANGIDGTYTFGYGQTVISQTQDAIAEALKVAGITVVGYRWQWRIKNADTNYYNEQNQSSADPLIVTVTVKDKQGNILDEREWDYSYYIYDWEQKYGMHWYDPFISGDKIDTITLEVEAYDAGYWAGYYGPEFGSAAIYSILVVEPEIQDCSDPLLDPTCPGYADALAAQQDEMIDLINNVTNEEVATGGEDVAFVAEITEVVEDSILEEPPAVEVEPLDEQVAEIEPEVEEESTAQSVDPLSVAQNAVSDALNEANSNAQSTLNSTAQSVADAQSTFESNEQKLQELSQNQIAETNQISSDIQQSNQEIQSSLEQSINEFQSQQQEQANQSNSSQSADSYGSNMETGNSSDMNVELGGLDNSQEINNMMNQFDNLGLDGLNENIGNNEIAIEVVVDSFEIAALDLAVNEVFQAALNKNLLALSEESEEEEQKSIEEQNAEEDALVEKALSGDDSEDAQAALLGYNPEFRAYQTPQLPDGQMYEPKEIYDGQENYDNPNQRFFNGASDATHKEMVRQQYKR